MLKSGKTEDYRVPKKMKNDHDYIDYLQTPNYKSCGEFWKIHDICSKMSTEIYKN